MTNRYQHYLRLVKILERLRRESDLELGPRLMDRIIDAQMQGELTPEEVMHLTGRVQHWVEEREAYFSSQEYQMRKLLKAMERDDKRSGRHKRRH